MIPENNPCKPTKAMAIIAATIRAIGKPLNALGTLFVSKRVRMHEKTTMIIKKPAEVPMPLANEFKNDL